MNGIIRFLKDWTLPVSIAVGTVSYLTFNYVPALDEAGDWLGSVFDVLFPISVFMTLFVTFCKVDFHEMRPHCWHAGILVAQLLLITVTVALAWSSDNSQLLTLNSQLSTLNSKLSTLNSKLFYEALLTCIIGPSASAAPVVVGKLGGNISTMTTYTLISSLASAIGSRYHLHGGFPDYSGEGVVCVIASLGVRLDDAALSEAAVCVDSLHA